MDSRRGGSRGIIGSYCRVPPGSRDPAAARTQEAEDGRSPAPSAPPARRTIGLTDIRRWRGALGALARIARYACTPSLHPRALQVRAYWWTATPNFGDRLTEALLLHYGIVPLHRHHSVAGLFGIGSVLEHVPEESTAWVWGSGKLFGDRPTTLPRARFLAVRGTLTRDLLGLDPETPVGDPGLLVSRWVPRPRARPGSIAVVPNHVHWDTPMVRELLDRLGPDAVLVDPWGSTRGVVRRITACETVLATSLHGLIVADSYGIPAARALPEPVIGGGEFKFRDYESAVLPERERRIDLDRAVSPAAVRELAGTVDAVAVRDRQDGLVGALERLRSEETQRVSPLLLPLLQFEGTVRRIPGLRGAARRLTGERDG